MLCENCNKNPAISFCTLDIDGNKKQVYLCGKCRKEYLIRQEQQQSQQTDIQNDVFCRNCGTTLKDFVASGQVGCQECYKAFYGVIKKEVLKYQKSYIHTGKMPKRFVKRTKLDELNSLLEKSLFNNDLEQVNRISREIKRLTGGEK